MTLIRLILRFVLASVRALIYPESPQEWRMAWIYFVFPIFFVGGFGIVVSWLIHLVIVVWLGWKTLGWILILLWLFYIWVCEPLAVLMTPEGHALQESQKHWIETGE